MFLTYLEPLAEPELWSKMVQQDPAGFGRSPGFRHGHGSSTSDHDCPGVTAIRNVQLLMIILLADQGNNLGKWKRSEKSVVKLISSGNSWTFEKPLVAFDKLDGKHKH